MQATSVNDNTSIVLAVGFEIAGRVMNNETISADFGVADTLSISPEMSAPHEPQTVYRMAGLVWNITFLVTRSAGGGVQANPVVARVSSDASPILALPLDANLTWLTLGDYAAQNVTLVLPAMSPLLVAALLAGGGMTTLTIRLTCTNGNAVGATGAAAAVVVLCASPASCPGAIISDFVTLLPGGGMEGYNLPAAVAVADFDSTFWLVATRVDPSGVFAGRTEASIFMNPLNISSYGAAESVRVAWEEGAGGARVVRLSHSDLTLDCTTWRKRYHW